MLNRKFKPLIIVVSMVLLAAGFGCKKGTFDINSNNPNTPSSVDPKFILSAALKSTATIFWGGDQEFANYYMGYWAVSGDYIPNSQTLTYNTTTGYFQDNWNSGYQILKNYQDVQTFGASYTNGANYVGIAMIMKAFMFQRLVDLYNNVPYFNALNATNLYPAYDNASAIYPSLVNQLDSAVAILKAAPTAADNPGAYDMMFGGTMSKWQTFAKTLKLKILLRLTQTTGGPAYIQSKLSGMTTADFIGAGADANVNPGYTNASGQQNPLWADIGWGVTGTATTNHDYYRACTYGVNFYLNTNDPRASYFYAVNSANAVQGRAFGSTNSNAEHNATISAVGGNAVGGTVGQATGVLKSPTMGVPLMTSTESLFLQAEAIQRGYLAGTLATVYQSAVSESFRILGVPSYAAAAATYTAQANNSCNITTTPNPLQTIILQKWAALNTYDAVESWSDWRRLKIPSDLPVSVYPGTTATNVPYRLLYPATEYSYNATNVNTQGTINNLTSKIFWQP